MVLLRIREEYMLLITDAQIYLPHRKKLFILEQSLQA